jgi:hypothetical protein
MLVILHGGIGPGIYGKSIDGYNIIFATNFLGNFLIAMRLSKIISDKGRLIITSSRIINDKICYQSIMSGNSWLYLNPIYDYGMANLCRSMLVKYFSK